MFTKTESEIPPDDSHKTFNIFPPSAQCLKLKRQIWQKLHTFAKFVHKFNL